MGLTIKKPLPLWLRWTLLESSFFYDQSGLAIETIWCKECLSPRWSIREGVHGLPFRVYTKRRQGVQTEKGFVWIEAVAKVMVL